MNTPPGKQLQNNNFFMKPQRDITSCFFFISSKFD